MEFWIILSELGDFLEYQARVRAKSNKNVKSEFVDNIELRGKYYHLDHLVSIRECFDNDIPVDICSHVCNLKIINAKENLSKGKSSSITISELLEEISEVEDYYSDDFE